MNVKREHLAGLELALNELEGLSGFDESRLNRLIAQASVAPEQEAVALDGAGHFRKRPVVIQAMEWTGENLRQVITFTDGPPDTRSMHAGMKWEEYCNLVGNEGLKIYTLEGVMRADVGDFIIKGIKGEHYPCKPDVFYRSYEIVDGPLYTHADNAPRGSFEKHMEYLARCIELERKLLQLEVAGAALANCAYNLSQQAGEPLLQRHADSLKRAYEQWDALIRSSTNEH